MEQQPTGKRPVALAVALILLVFSVMGNVLLLTKNIEHTRSSAEREGEAIFAGFAGSRDYLEHMGQYAEQLLQLAGTDADAARLTAAHMADAAVREGKVIASLMAKAEETGGSGFAGAGQAAADYLSVRVGEELKRIGEGAGPLAPEEREAAKAIQSAFDDLSKIVSSFHFAMEGSRGAMIRLSSGFEWLDIAERMHDRMLEPAPADAASE